MKKTFRVMCLILPLILALSARAQKPGDPVPGVGGDDPYIKFLAMIKESGHTTLEPVRVRDADFVLFDPLDPELGEFFSQFGAAIVAMNMGDWRNTQAALVAVNLEQNRLVSTFGENGMARVDFPGQNDFVQSIFAQPDGKLVAGGYTTTGEIAQIALARFQKNGKPDSSFGTNGYALYSQHADDQTKYQYNVCRRIAPVYGENGGIREYIAAGWLSHPDAYGRALVCFDSSGKVIKRTVVSRDSSGNPITIPNINGAILQEPWNEITGLVTTPGDDFFAVGGSSSGSHIMRFTVNPDTFKILGSSPFNPDPENFPDQRVEIAGAAYYPDPSTLFTGGNFMPDSQDPVHDTNIPFVSKDALDENGGLKNRELLFPPPSAYYTHEPISISDLKAPRFFSSSGGVYKRSVIEKWFYVMAESRRLDGQGQDVMIWRYLADGSIDEEFGDNGVVELDFGPDDWWVASAITARGDILVCVNAGDEIFLTLRQGSRNTGLRASDAPPGEFTLHPVFPNPFNPQTAISFHLSRAEKIRLAVFDVKGREVETLLSGSASAGDHRLVWDGSGLASGTYFVRLATQSFVKTRKAALLK